MSKRVFFLDDDGNIVREFESVTIAAEKLGITRATLNYYVVYRKKNEGCTVDVEGMTDEEKDDILQRRVETQKIYQSKKEKKSEVVGGKKRMDAKHDREGYDDEVTPKQMLKQIKKLEDEGFEVEVIRYEKRWGRVCITPCMKKILSERKLIGTIECVKCRYFRGRCQERSEVICVFNHYQKKVKPQGRPRTMEGE